MQTIPSSKEQKENLIKITSKTPLSKLYALCLNKLHSLPILSNPSEPSPLPSSLPTPSPTLPTPLLPPPTSSYLLLEAVGKSTGNLVSLVGKLKKEGGRVIRMEVDGFFDEKKRRRKLRMRVGIERIEEIQN